MSDKVQRFEANAAGRDFIVGDLHGMFDMLTAEMDRVRFDPAKDRLFSVGDLVDRGPQSKDAVNWLAQPWFHSVRGNHEDMAIQFACGRAVGYYEANGGKWFMDLPPKTQAAVAQAFLTMPIAIEIKASSGLVGIVHAEPYGINWQNFTAMLEEGDFHAESMALWSRSRISSGNRMDVQGVHAVYVGHTPQERPKSLGNVHYIDTGAVFGGRLTIVQIDGPGTKSQPAEAFACNAD